MRRSFSAGNTRGLIEAGPPRVDDEAPDVFGFSAGNTRGLIEAVMNANVHLRRVLSRVFRGEYPRPH